MTDSVDESKLTTGEKIDIIFSKASKFALSSIPIFGNLFSTISDLPDSFKQERLNKFVLNLDQRIQQLELIRYQNTLSPERQHILEMIIDEVQNARASSKSHYFQNIFIKVFIDSINDKWETQEMFIYALGQLPLVAIQRLQTSDTRLSKSERNRLLTQLNDQNLLQGTDYMLQGYGFIEFTFDSVTPLHNQPLKISQHSKVTNLGEQFLNYISEQQKPK